jgi:hypothetical protein
MVNTTRAIAHFTDLIHELRPDWHRAGIAAALRTAGFEAQPVTVAQVMLHRAANPANLTPRLQPADYQPAPTVTCGIRGNWPHGRCAGCIDDQARQAAADLFDSWTLSDERAARQRAQENA